MHLPLDRAGFPPAPSPALVPSSTDPDAAAARLYVAAERLSEALEQGRAIDPPLLATSMTDAFGASDAAGAWSWKQAHDAAEGALVLFLRRLGPAMLARASSPERFLAMLGRLAAQLPSQTRRSEESVAFQQFSTPLPLAYVASVAAGVTPDDVVLEPSAGTGLLAAFADLAGSRLALNELAAVRAGLLVRLFRVAAVTRHDAEAIHDRLDPEIKPSVVMMNPPFSASPQVEARRAAATFHHVSAALARLRPDGRLVAITAEAFAPENPAWAAAFARFAERGGKLLASVPIARGAFARHGTSIATRLLVIDKAAEAVGASLPASLSAVEGAADLLRVVLEAVPSRAPLALSPALPSSPALRSLGARPAPVRPLRPARRAAEPSVAAAELIYEIVAPETEGRADPALSAALYEPYRLQVIRIPDAKPHPTALVQSAAMASVAPPRPSYRPLLPSNAISDGLLSDAQAESVIYAGEAHSGHLAGSYLVDDRFDAVTAAPPDGEGAVRFRRGWFLGDGTGSGKGRQVAGVLMDNWLRGRRRHVWISKSDTLIEDAQRDWSALGGEPLQITPLSRYRQGAPIALIEGILFTTYATLRSEERQGSQGSSRSQADGVPPNGKASRLAQIVEWCGADFDGCIVFDEAHAMANAAGGSGERGDVAPSQQGRAGLRLQHALPDARVLYVSATGAVEAQNLAYAQRLGLWGTGDFPFAARGDFVAAMENGGVAALEVMARDLRALGLYAARSLSYEGVEVDILQHDLTPEQTRIYDAYAGAFQVIHQNLTAALEATNITGERGEALNRQAKSAARSAFESNKQRFFSHLLTAMKCPSLIRAIEQDLEAGHAAVVQIVSTAEALLDRRLAEIPTAEWGDLSVDVTPREYVLDYLKHSWPTQLFVVRSDSEGRLYSEPATDEHGQPVVSQEAVAQRNRVIEHLAALPAVQGALDQIVQRFGTDTVAEVTGRSRRIVCRKGEDGETRHVVETRPASANLSETQAFMDSAKRVLVFSDAGGTGRSYHADLAARNQRLRVHYLLEPGWRADNAIQGLGRTNRTNQKQPPLFRPVTTNVKGERRFISTIARRLDTLGAITRGQRQTGGQGLFRPEDSLEGPYAKAALRQLYILLVGGKVEGCSLGLFQDQTGLTLVDRDGSIRDELPPITTFLNRVLALRIDLQNLLFDVFEGLLEARVEQAIQSGTYDRGVETLTAESFRVTDRRIIYTHPGTGAETKALTVVERRRSSILSLDDAIALASLAASHRLLVNAKSGRAAVQVSAPSLMLDEGDVLARTRLVRPTGRDTLTVTEFGRTHWRPSESADAFAQAWSTEVAGVPPFQEETFHIVTGLLLPIWDRLGRPDEGSGRVYRLQTDEGERIIGRLVSAAGLARLRQELGLTGSDTCPPSLTPVQCYDAVLRGEAALQLAGEHRVKRSLVAGQHRIELTGFGDSAVEPLKALGLHSEILAWKLRLFVPVDPTRGPAILSALLARHPLMRVAGANQPAPLHAAAA